MCRLLRQQGTSGASSRIGDMEIVDASAYQVSSKRNRVVGDVGDEFWGVEMGGGMIEGGREGGRKGRRLCQLIRLETGFL